MQHESVKIAKHFGMLLRVSTSLTSALCLCTFIYGPCANVVAREGEQMALK